MRNSAAQPGSLPDVRDARSAATWGIVPFLLSERSSGRIIEANGPMCELTGFTAEELRTMTVFSLGLWLSPSQRSELLNREAASVPRSGTMIRTRAGSQVPVIHGWQLAASDSTEIVAELVIDMSESVRTQQRLERLSRFRGVLSTLLSESLDRGLDAGFYQRVLQAAVDTIPAAHTASLLVRGADDRFRFTAAIGCDLQTLQAVSFAEDEMVIGEDGAPLLHHGYSENAGLAPEVRDLIDSSGPNRDIKVTIVTPVLLDGEAVAIFNLDNLASPDAFEEEALGMALDFARHIAVLLQRFRFERELWLQANVDALTGLPNRNSFEATLEETLRRSARHGSGCAVLFVDLDNFKSFNDTYGHSFGDQLVRAVTDRLAALLPAEATIARWGGDELIVLMPDTPSVAAAERTAELLLSASADTYDVGGIEAQVTLSIGIALSPAAGTTGEELTRNADVAVYRAKQAGRNTWRVFNDQMRAEVLLQAELREAVAQQKISLHYQPRFDTSGRVRAMEALARWQHPERGLLPASEFIAAAEQARVMPKLGEDLLDSAVAQAREWLNLGHEIPVAFNLSGLQLASDGVVAHVDAVLRKHALPPHLLELQIPETSAVSDAVDPTGKLRQLRQLGVRLLLDGMGGGFTNLAMLKRFELDGMKIPREFVRALRHSETDQRQELAAEDVVAALAGLGNDLGIQVIAEGVESEWQFGFLRANGVTRVQGFLFSDALPPAQATELLARNDPDS